MGGQGQPQLDGGGGREGQLDHVADALLGDEVVHDAHAQPLLDHGDGGEVLQRGEADVGWHGFRFTHSLGQNFILDDELLERILDLALIEPDGRVLEIGPGAGMMIGS